MRFESGFTTAQARARAASGLAEAAGAIILALGRCAELLTAERGSRRAALARRWRCTWRKSSA